MAKIVAIVVQSASKAAGGSPIFIAANDEEQRRLAFTLEKILDATAHDLQNDTFILVDHSNPK